MRLHRAFFPCLTSLALVLGCGGDENNASPTGGGTTPVGSVTTIEKPENAIEGEYIFLLDPDTVTPDQVKAIADALLAPHGGSLISTYEAGMLGFAAKDLDDAKALAMAKDPRVTGLGQNGYLELYAVQQDPVWGLDYVDGHYYFDKKYEYYFTGNGVHAYVIDSGIRSTHKEFTGRIGPGISYIADGKGTEDCNGHGTHVAGTLGGTTYGVAKGVTLHPVRVADCSGGLNLAGAIAGISWVIQNHVKPAVINMSAGTSAYGPLDQAASAAVAAGIVFVAAAGNPGGGGSLASYYSPGRVNEVINVGAINSDYWTVLGTNYGSAIDIFAPGDKIVSAGIDSDTGTATKSGTSMAAPHVAGTIALYLEANPSATPTAASIALTVGATKGMVKGDKNAPNNIVYSRYMEPKGSFIDGKNWDTYYSDGGVWDDSPAYWSTIQFPDINGDKKMDVCGRAPGGIVCETSNGSSFTGLDTWTPSFEDAGGWAGLASLYATIRFPDLNGDGKADVCGRASGGIYCGLSNGKSFDSVSQWDNYYTDGGVWDDSPAYWSTIEFPDINGDGKADVCGRAPGGIVCETSNGTSFTGLSTWTASFDDASGWGGVGSLYGTVRFPDINGDGKADVCGRSSIGIVCGLSNGTSFEPVTQWDSYYTDAGVWDENPAYWGTIEFIDINGDKMMDVCGRAPGGIVCETSNGTSFTNLNTWSTGFGDASGWQSAPAYWGTIDYADINGDGMVDVCGRDGGGLYCGLSTGKEFSFNRTWDAGFSDGNGWAAKDVYWSTIRFPDINGDGKADACGRNGGGIRCSVSWP